MNQDTLTQIYSYQQDDGNYLQINRFLPDLTLTMETYLLPEEGEPKEEDLLYELSYPVQESKYRSLIKRARREFPTIPQGNPQSPSLLRLEGDTGEIRYSLEENNLPSSAFQKLNEVVTRIVTYSSIPSG